MVVFRVSGMSLSQGMQGEEAGMWGWAGLPESQADKAKSESFLWAQTV